MPAPAIGCPVYTQLNAVESINRLATRRHILTAAVAVQLLSSPRPVPGVWAGPTPSSLSD